MPNNTHIEQALREEALYGRILTFSERRQIADLYDRGCHFSPGVQLWSRFVINENRECSPLPRLQELQTILNEHHAIVSHENVQFESYHADKSN
jgi:hypothetical protein